jgi:large subunit ribosomal protein L4
MADVSNKQSLDVLDAKGKKTGSVDLPATVFDVQTNIPLIHQVVTAQLAAARQGTHKTKGRGEVSGSGVKPFKQKGTGRSRQGSVRAPEHRGGGIVHGPVPRSYAQRTPKKMIAAALLGVISDRARGERLHVVEGFGTVDGAPSTKAAVELLAGLNGGHGVTRKVLIVLERGDANAEKSVRNLKDLHVLYVDQLNAYDVVVSDDVVFTKAAYDTFVSAKTQANTTKTEEAGE